MLSMGTGIKLPSQAVFILYKLFLGLALWLSSTGTKNVGLRIPRPYVLALEEPSGKTMRRQAHVYT
jgi:hypothetical protein